MATEKTTTDFCEDLMWFLTCSGSAMGERGTLGGITSVLEHGGQTGGVPNTDLYSEQQIGWGKFVFGDVEKHRWLTAAWLGVSRDNQKRLVARYTAPRAEYRGDAGYGARDRYVEGSDHSVVATSKGTRTGTALLLGDLAGLAFSLTDKPEELFLACVEPSPWKRDKAGEIVRDKTGRPTIDREKEKERRRLRGKWLKDAETKSAEAHLEWAESKAGADPMRKRSERRPVLVTPFTRLDPYVPAEADVA